MDLGVMFRILRTNWRATTVLVGQGAFKRAIAVGQLDGLSKVSHPCKPWHLPLINEMDLRFRTTQHFKYVTTELCSRAFGIT